MNGKENVSMRHVQVPNVDLKREGLQMKDMVVYAYLKSHQNSSSGECFPSLQCLVQESGLSKPTIIKCIERLEKSGYIYIDRSGRYNRYTFSDYKKFEIYSFDFLYDKSFDIQDKIYIMNMQRYMYKDEISGRGVVQYSDFDIANMLNIDIRTLRKYEQHLLKNHNVMQLVPSKIKDPNTGLYINERVFDLESYHNLLCVKFRQIDDDVNTIKEENKRLWQEIDKLKKQIRYSQVEDASISIE